MTALDDVKLRITNAEPRVWVERLLILSGTDPLDVIRDISLHRGVNIVWAREDESDDSGPVVVHGHSAGKTTFCRLLRYCLGEPNFGTKDSQPLIRDSFPSGYVGAQILVNGQRWAVARPIGAGNRHYAAVDATVEGLLKSKSPENDFDHFRTALSKACVGHLPVREVPRTGQVIDWLHILAWCARDQEARYQEHWQWRSPRSNHETPQFNRPKIDGLFLMRLLLSLYVDQEAKIERQVAELEAEAERLADETVQARQEPQYWHDHRIKELKQHLGIAEDLPLESSGLFEPSFDSRVAKRQEAIDGNIAALHDEDRELARDEYRLRSQRAEVHRRLSQCTAALKQHEAAATELQEALCELEKDQDEDFTDPYWQCPYSGRPVKDVQCWEIYQQRKESPASFSLTKQAERLRHVNAMEARQSEVATWQSVAHELTVQSRTLRGQYEDIRRQRADLATKRASLQHESHQLKCSLSDAMHWRDILSGNERYARLDELKQHRKINEEAVRKAKVNLTELLNRHSKHRARIAALFDACVKSVLNDSYDGAVELTEEELSFRLLHGPPLGGEAINTLMILLADLVAMIAHVDGVGHMPALLIHDSPREADLGQHIYWNLLRLVAEIANRLSRDDSAAFQYIVTTTTSPPPDMRHGSYVVLPLDASDPSQILFRKVLTPSEQTLLP